jgi:formylmethanofuran dehydrogenase subunit E
MPEKVAYIKTKCADCGRKVFYVILSQQDKRTLCQGCYDKEVEKDAKN